MAVVPAKAKSAPMKPAGKKVVLPTNAKPGVRDASDVARLNIYLGRIKNAQKNMGAPPAGGKAKDVYDAKMAKLTAKFDTYKARKSEYRKSYGDTAAKRRAQPSTKT